MKQLSDFILVENIIPKELCETVISEMEDSSGWQQHVWYGGDSKDKSKELDILYSDLMTVFNPIVKQGLNLYIKTNGNVASLWGPIRLNKYSVGKQMAVHSDLIKSHPEDGIPTLSFVGILNDNYSGGDFIMFDDMKIVLKQGDILIFPSTFLYPHKVTEVTKGTRYSFVTWIY